MTLAVGLPGGAQLGRAGAAGARVGGDALVVVGPGERDARPAAAADQLPRDLVVVAEPLAVRGAAAEVGAATARAERVEVVAHLGAMLEQRVRRGKAAGQLAAGAGRRALRQHLVGLALRTGPEAALDIGA